MEFDIFKEFLKLLGVFVSTSFAVAVWIVFYDLYQDKKLFRRKQRDTDKR
jgi:hypothetical protein